MSRPARTPLIVDVAVVGGGALGAATAWLLARRGTSVALVEEGSARSLREAARGTAWSAHPGWADAGPGEVAEAVALWRAVESETGAALVRVNDALGHGRCRTGTAAVSPADAAARWPGTSFAGPVDVRRGVQVCADQAIAALTAAAAGQGAVLRHRVGLLDVHVEGDRVEIRTAAGRVSARRAVVTRVEPCCTGIELHFAPGAPGLPLVAHHDDELGLVRAAPCAAGHLAVSTDGSDAADDSAAERLREYVRTWFPGTHPDRVEPVAPGAESTRATEPVVDRAGPVVHVRSAGAGAVRTPVWGRLLAEVVTAAPSRFPAPARRVS